MTCLSARGKTMKDACILPLVCVLTACSVGTGPTTLDDRVAVWKLEEADMEARQDADMVRQDDDHAQSSAVWQAERHEEGKALDRQNDARQRANAILVPAMKACLTGKVHVLAPGEQPESDVADAVLAACQPQIEAVARTVELVGISSRGLESDMAVRQRPWIVRMVHVERTRIAAHSRA